VPGDVTGNLRDARLHGGEHHALASDHQRYTAYAPPTSDLLNAVARRLPDAEALARLVDLVPVRWLVVHRNDLTAWEGRAWQRGVPEGLELVQRFGTDDLYAVTAAPHRDWRAALLQRAAAAQPATLEGRRWCTLPAPCRIGRVLEVTPPPVMYPLPLPVAVPVRFANDSDLPMAGLRRPARPSGRLVVPLGLAVRRRVARGPVHAAHRRRATARRGRGFDGDRAAGREFGEWRCEIILLQLGSAEPIARTNVTVTLQPWPGFRPEKTM
jgi:hypothetical protein